ncbi:MAG: GSU3473 family protein [Trichloromonadaceae bacterium]
MLIRIVYEDGRYDLVKPFKLNSLLAENQVRMFLRGGRWVMVGRDALRRSRLTSYSGADRRRALNS